MIGHTNLSFEIAGALVLAILLFYVVTQYEMPTLQSKTFRNMISFMLCAELLDLVSAYVSAQPSIYGIVFIIAINTLYFCSLFWAAYYLLCYALLPVHGEKYFGISIVLNRILLAIGLVLALFTPFTGALFYVNESGAYTHGPLHAISYIIPLIYMIEAAFYILLFHKNYGARQHTVIIAFIFIGVGSLLLQAFAFKHTLLTFFGASLGSLVLFFGLETPDYRNMVFAVDRLEELKSDLENEVARQVDLSTQRQNRIAKLSLETVQALAGAINEKDVYTQGHSTRVAVYSAALAYKMGWDVPDVDAIYQAGMLHDIGKIGVRDSILNKPGRLSDEEFEELKMHTRRGAKILENLTSYPSAKDVALRHHERWDGKGYPDGLSGSEIPLVARLVSIADAYDAMNTARVYRDALSKETIRQELLKGSGTQFDPVPVRAFVDLLDNGVLDKLNESLEFEEALLGPCETAELINSLSKGQ